MLKATVLLLLLLAVGSVRADYCDAIVDPDLRAFCRGDCGSIQDADLRAFCTGNCGSIQDADARNLCRAGRFAPVIVSE